jgi:ribosomal protein S6
MLFCPFYIGKKYLKNAIIIDESLILAIVSRNYSTKPSYILQLKRQLKVWKYILKHMVIKRRERENQ